MARIDPAMALEWSAQLGGELDPTVRLIGAEVLAAFDAQAALEVIKKTPDRSTMLEKLLELATWYVETDPTKARLFAQEAAVAARAVEEPERARAKARAGALLIQLGQKDAGTKLVEEAVAALPRPAPGAANAAARVQPSPALIATACALAQVDLKRAQALVEPIQDPGFRERIQARFAVAIARTNPGLAMDMIKKQTNRQREQYNTLIGIVYRCGALHPDEALKIVEEMNEDQALQYKAEALGWLAVALAKTDSKRAVGLIDQALALLIDEAPTGRYWRSSGGPEMAAARVALCARRMGYPDMDSVIARVLATRPSPGQLSGDVWWEHRIVCVAARPDRSGGRSGGPGSG